MRVQDSIARAVREGAPVVALETAVLTHGFSRPTALVVYASMREAVIGEGALPAPVGVVGGELVVGLGESELKRLDRGYGVEKAGLADLAPLAAKGCDAGTTVAATLWASGRAGIRVFATGGIGGVHRGAEATFDVSGDLTALGRFGGVTVCSGAKAICDLPKTMELLETMGVAVVGFRTDEMPAFICNTSGLKLRHRADTPEEVARIAVARDRLGLSASILVVQPCPEDAALGRSPLEGALHRALAEAHGEGISGAALTPALLSRLETLTEGSSAAANRALLLENARLAARISFALSEIGRSGPNRPA
jgi:pseudouridine-5'-phosphate glycosidase